MRRGYPTGDRQGRQDRGRDVGRADLPVPHPGAVDRAGLADRRRRGHRRHRRAACADPPVADLGLRRGDGPARHDHRDRAAGVLRPPWERGSNENLNRIVREYFPKGVEISSDPKYLAMVACDINDRPRKIHNWKKPSELFTELVESNASTG